MSLARETAAVLFFVMALFLGLSLYSYLVASPEEVQLFGDPSLKTHNIMGLVGLKAAKYFIVLLGWCSFITVIWAMFLARTIWIQGWPACSKSWASLLVSSLSLMAMASSAAVMASVVMGEKAGGTIGSSASTLLIRYVNKPGTFLLMGAVFLVSVGMSTGVGTAQVLTVIKLLAALAVQGAIYAWVLFLRGLAFSLKHLSYGMRFAAHRLYQLSRKGLILVLSLLRLHKFAYSRFGEKHPDESPKPNWVKEEVKKLARPAHSDGFVLGAAKEEIALDSTALPEPESQRLAFAEPVILRRDQASAKKNAIKPLRRRSSREGNGKAEKRSKKGAAEAAVEKEFILPGFELLVSGEGSASTSPQDTDLIKNSRQLEQALRNFRIGGRVTEVHPGPVVTLYQFEPAAGVKVQRVISLADDLALALKVGSVRVYAPVPGKGTVGIEVPNAHRDIVRLREVLESEEFQTFQSPLSLALGKDTYGEPYVVSLAKMPHLLIAGATGTGKSVCINSVLVSLLFRYTPQELRLLLIDPKMLELSLYEDIPHLKAPVITQPKRARGVLWWAVEEMERRYKLMKVLGVRDISMYNRIVGDKGNAVISAMRSKSKKDQLIELEEKDVIATGSPYEGLDRGSEFLLRAAGASEGAELEALPRIVIVVDELADLMLTVGREIEELLARLAQKARAAGIHLILATQRPSVNVITGLIKANFPARVSFKVASKIDARTVMDLSGAEKLLGQGDMLYMSPGIGGVKRLHSPYVSDKEVHDVVDWLRAQGSPDYDSAIEKMIQRVEDAEAGAVSGNTEGEEFDSLYDQAVNAVVEKGFASTSMVQRIFRIGYNRAARILEMMEREGVVGPADGAKPRQVLVGNSDAYNV